MKAEVDAHLCQGHARCWDICPEVFAVDEEGHGFVPVAELPTEYEVGAREAAANCPERAITIS
ncbi:ferredoxin [Frankia sp. Mgl5]|uniref:ferredoxin n=1 Tax=Frankiaceae TaxID=74712 RepID=UPI00200DF448|nr:ferredoxin [Frankia sp. Mgl5]MCK9931139.1 ferredoxin [Frankia sp. Mgl5]